MIGRWKMLDNLRRTLLAPSAWLALVTGLTLPPAAAIPWSGFILATIAVPTLMPFLSGFVPRRFGISKRSHLRAVGTDLSLALSQIGFGVTFLAHQTWLMTDAIARTLFRLFVTRRRMLEWVTAAQATLGPRLDLGGIYRRMAGGIALAVAAAILVACAGQAFSGIALPFLTLWMLSPAIARWASLPPPAAGRKPVSAADAHALRSIARRTWRFFETFVTPEDHMLPPDNFQEDPKPVVAHRTSPTNLGLYLLSVVAARDFGWLGLLDTVERLDATLTSMNALERFRGHFYNWYATQDLRPLEPKYVSSVDSGNLAGHLIALESACREMIGRPVVSPEWLAGIGDTLALTREALQALADDRRTQTVSWKQLDEALEALASSLSPAPATPAAVAARLAEMVLQVDTVIDIARTLAVERGDGDAVEVLTWAEALGASVRAHERDVLLLMPFAPLLAAEPLLRPLFDSIPTLANLPDRCEAALAILASQPTERAAPLLDALERSSGRRPIARATSHGDSPSGEKHAPGDGLRVPVRHRATAALDRVSRGRRRARSQLLRPARFGSASRELRRNRQGRHPGAALVPPRAGLDAGRPRLGADLVVGIDVRIPDAVAGDARAGREPARADEPLHRASADQVRGRASVCPGAFRNRRTTRETSSSPINTRTSASPAWG